MTVDDRDVAEGTRSRLSLLTDPEVEVTWSRLTRGLTGYLRARGVPPCDIDDYMQEAVQRAASKQVTYESAEELLAWCITVARNLVIDDARRSARRDVQVAHQVVVRDAEAEVMSQFAAFELLDAFGALSSADRDAITLRERTSDRTEANRLAQRRTRARRRLRDSLMVVLGGWGWGLALRRAAHAAPATLVAAASVVALGVAGDPWAARDSGSLPLLTPVEERVELTAPPVSRRSADAASVTALAAPSHGSPAPPKEPQRQRVTVQPLPVPQGVYVEKRPATPADPLMCVRSIPAVGAVCTPELNDDPKGGSHSR